MGKGKAPAFQFYVKDWLCDPELRLASVLSRGAWIDCLCFMWENSQRGKLTATPLKFAKLISGSLDEALHFLNDMNECEFGDIEIPEGIKFPITENECNIKVTIINRRMYSDYKDKQNTRLRVRKHREKKKVTEKKQKSNANVTVTSPSPSPTSKIKKKDIRKKKFIPPDIKDVIQFFINNNYTKESAIKAFKYYSDGEPPWTDSQGKPVRGWKQKMRGVWFKPENKNNRGGEQIQPKTYAQAQDAERRGRAAWLKKEMRDDNQENSEQGADKVIPVLPHS